MNTDLVTPKGFLDSLKSLFVPEHAKEAMPEDTTHEKDFAYVDEHQETYEAEASYDDYSGDAIPPIPVKIVTEKPAVEVPKAAQWFTSSHYILRSAANTQQGAATLISSRDLRKRAVTIVNNGTDYIVIGSNSNLSLTNSGRIKAGQSLTMDCNSDVYAMPNTDQTDIDVFAEYEIGGTD
jgi:hypothetical protein